MKVTTTGAHGLSVGDQVYIKRGRWASLKRLLIRPRVAEIVAMNDTEMTIRERRMTWAEWRAAFASLFR